MPKSVIMANGTSSNPSDDLSHVDPDDTIICADGGAMHALAMGLTPDLIVGDLDSLPKNILDDMIARGVEIQRHPVKKDRTDLELTLSAAIERGAEEVLILNAFGGRMDQHLANILLLTRPEWRPCRLSLADGAQKAWLLRGPDEIEIFGRPGDALSLVPLSPIVGGVDLIDLEWPTDNITVAMGDTLTISNSLTDARAVVRIKTGVGLVIHISKAFLGD